MIKDFNNKYVYDIEVFPNFFSVIFVDIKSDEKKTFVIYKTRNDLEKLKLFLKNKILLIGYNNIYYDGAILHYLLENTILDTDELLESLFYISNKVISDESRFDRSLTELRKENSDYGFYQLDLMKILAFDKMGISLKQTSINLKWHKVQDLPLPYNHYVKPEEINLVLDYNLNDVLITFELYKKILPQIELREDLSQLFNVDLLNASDSKMANILLEEIYSKESNIDISTIRNLRTKRNQFMLKDCFANDIYFETNILKKLKIEIENILVRKENNYKYSKKTVEFAGCRYELGVGGLHSVDEPGYFVADDKYRIVDLDFSSFYPSIMIKNKFKPEHLGDEFINILEKITKERLEAKHSNDNIKAAALKITINSIYGKLGSNTFWLEDPKAMISVTISGQMYLLMLIEKLILNGIPTISANTDGIVCKVPWELNDKLLCLAKEFENQTGFEIEFTDYSLYVRSDVNNYFTKKLDGKTKEKGRYSKEIDIKKGYNSPIIKIAMYEYFMNNTNVLETYKNSTDILDFCYSQKIGKDFQLEFHKNDNIEILQKNNRFFISTDGGKLIKRRLSNDSTIGLNVSQLTTILNDYDKNKNINDYNIDYDYYVFEAYKYITPIEKSKNNIFDFSINDIPDEEVRLEKPDLEIENLLLKLEGIKGLSNNVVDNLITMNKEFKGNNFLDLLVYATENSIISIKFKDLIKIRYFEKYGKNKKLYYFFEEFTCGKNKYNKTHKKETKNKRIEELKKVWNSIKNENFTIQEQIKNELDIINTVRTTFPINKNYAVALSIDTKYSPRIEFQNLLTGERKTFKIKKKVYNEFPINKGDILLFKKVTKKNSMTKNEEGKWVEIEDKFDLWLEVYYIVKENDKLIR